MSTLKTQNIRGQFKQFCTHQINHFLFVLNFYLLYITFDSFYCLQTLKIKTKQKLYATNITFTYQK